MNTGQWNISIELYWISLKSLFIIIFIEWFRILICKNMQTFEAITPSNLEDFLNVCDALCCDKPIHGLLNSLIDTFSIIVRNSPDVNCTRGDFVGFGRAGGRRFPPGSSCESPVAPRALCDRVCMIPPNSYHFVSSTLVVDYFKYFSCRKISCIIDT